MAVFSITATVVALSPAGATETDVTFELRDPSGAAIGTFVERMLNAAARNLAPYQPGVAEAQFAVGSVDVQGVLASSLPAHTAGSITTNPYPASPTFQVAPQYVGSNAASLAAKFYFRHSGSDTHIADTTVSASGLIGTVNLSSNTGAGGDSIVIKLFDGATEIGLDSVLPS